MEINIDTIWFDNFLELVDERLTSSLDPKHLVDFRHIVTGSFRTIKERMSKTFPETASIGLEDNVLILFFLAV